MVHKPELVWGQSTRKIVLKIKKLYIFMFYKQAGYLNTPRATEVSEPISFRQIALQIAGHRQNHRPALDGTEVLVKSSTVI